MIEDLLLRRKEVLSDLEDDDRPQTRQQLLMQQLRSINRALGEDEDLTGDDLANYWDAQLERGEEPDLDLTVEDLRQMRERGEA